MGARTVSIGPFTDLNLFHKATNATKLLEMALAVRAVAQDTTCHEMAERDANDNVVQAVCAANAAVANAIACLRRRMQVDRDHERH